MKKSLNSLLATWQIRGVAGRRSVSLATFDAGAKPFSSGNKETDRLAVEQLAGRIDELQDMMFAVKRHKLLVVLQGLDGSGKDGTVRGVFARTSPLGVRTVGWRAPSEEERAHDFLWRIHARVPQAGEIMVFTRSHYEDVLVPRVTGTLDAAAARQRYAHINDFERMLSETGTVILKFMLHISKDEQRERLQARIDDPTKQWKLNLGDFEVRKQWKQYQQAYAALLAATSTAWAPWTIVPANSKTHRNLMIATVVVDKLKSLRSRYPDPDPRLASLQVE